MIEFCKLPDETAQEFQVAAGKALAERFLKVLNDHVLGKGNKYLCGDALTIADYLASGMISIVELIGGSFANYPNIAAWYARMQALPNWKSANAGLYEWAKHTAGGSYVRI